MRYTTFLLRPLDSLGNLLLWHQPDIRTMIQILVNRHLRVKRSLLRQETDEPLRLDRVLPQINPVDKNIPLRLRQHVTYNIHGGRLTCTV